VCGKLRGGDYSVIQDRGSLGVTGPQSFRYLVLHNLMELAQDHIPAPDETVWEMYNLAASVKIAGRGGVCRTQLWLGVSFPLVYHGHMECRSHGQAIVFMPGPKMIRNPTVVDLAVGDLGPDSVRYITEDSIRQTNSLYPKLFSVDSDMIANGIGLLEEYESAGHDELSYCSCKHET
jgi:hypothetical protein